jgi:hypothetical protein
MNFSDVGGSVQRSQVVNAVPLQNAVLCAECDVVSDSPHDICLVCGSRSLFNIAHVFGGKLPAERVSLVAEEAVRVSSREFVLPFPKPHRPRRRATSGSHQLAVLGLNENDTNPQSASRPDPRKRLNR